MKLGAKGIKTQVSGRLGGALPFVLNNIQKELFHFILYADIDYAHAEAENYLR